MAAADSLAVDAHKWLSVPYEAGAVLVRDEEGLRAAFSRVPAYLREDSDPDGVTWLPWFSEYGTQQTPRVSARSRCGRRWPTTAGPGTRRRSGGTSTWPSGWPPGSSGRPG